MLVKAQASLRDAMEKMAHPGVRPASLGKKDDVSGLTRAHHPEEVPGHLATNFFPEGPEDTRKVTESECDSNPNVQAPCASCQGMSLWQK